MIDVEARSSGSGQVVLARGVRRKKARLTLREARVAWEGVLLDARDYASRDGVAVHIRVRP